MQSSSTVDLALKWNSKFYGLFPELEAIIARDLYLKPAIRKPSLGFDNFYLESAVVKIMIDKFDGGLAKIYHYAKARANATTLTSDTISETDSSRVLDLIGDLLVKKLSGQINNFGVYE